MNINKFNMHDAVFGIPDVRFIIAIMFNSTDLLFIKKVLNKIGYPFGSPEMFVNNLNIIHREWLSNGRDIDKMNGYGGMTDPFNELEKSLGIKTFSEHLKDFK